MWRALLKHLIDRPVVALEIGAYEGRSTLWWLDNILTHENARLMVVDPFGRPKDQHYRRFLHNLSLHIRSHQVNVIRSASRNVLHSIPDQSLDFAYIDGSHEVADLLFDCIAVWHKMKPGGVMILDDYKWENPHGHKPPKIAIDAFVQCMTPKVLHSGYQIVFEKN